MAYTAEHLDLITNVKDSFTEDLTRLSALLETIGEQADALDPIRIDVDVNDRELKQLETRLTALQGLDATDNVRAGFAKTPFDTSSSDSHTLSDVSETLQSNFRSLESTIDKNFDTGERSRPISVPTGQMGTMMGAVAASQAGDATPDGGDGDGDFGPQIFGMETINAFENIFGVTPDSLVNREQSVGQLITGEAPLTGVGGDQLDELVDPANMLRAFDFEQFTENVGGTPDGFQFDARSIAGLSGKQLAKMAGFDNHQDFLKQHTNRRRLMFERLKDTIADIRVGMTQFWDLFAAALPLVFVFVGALPAAATGVAALGAAALGAAGALGAIGGLGLLGAATQQAGGQKPGFEDFSAALDGIGDDFFEAFRDEAQRLAPLFEDGLDALGQFFDDLARRAQLLDMLREDARAFGGFVTDFLANTFEELIRFADAARPVFTMIAEGLSGNNIIRGLAGFLAEVLPQLAMLTTMLVKAIPNILQFSQGMLQTATHVAFFVRMVLGAIAAFAEWLPFVKNGNRFLGQLVGGFLALSTVILFTSKMMGVFQVSMIQSTVAMIKTKLAAIGLTGAMASLTAVTATFLALTGAGAVLALLGAGAMKAGANFAGLSSNVDEATKSLKEFERQESRMAGRGGRFMGDLDETVYVDVDNSVTVEGDADRDTVTDIRRMQSFSPSGNTTDTLGK